MKKLQGLEIDLEKEYLRLVENEMIYYDEIGLWDKSFKIAVIVVFISLFAITFCFSLFPEDTPPSEILNYPFQFYLLIFTILLFISSLQSPCYQKRKLIKSKPN